MITPSTTRVAAAAVGTSALVLSGLAVAGPAAADRPAHPGQKTYTADLQPLNDSDAAGSATMTLRGNRFTAMVDVTGLDDTLHPQHIHAGTMCPPPEADTNHDGYIDVIEGIPYYGGIFVNLDGDFTDPAANIASFPTGSSYSYEETATRGLYQDANGEALKLGTRHVVVHGVDPSTELPDTVQSLPGLPATATLPVACGELSLNH